MSAVETLRAYLADNGIQHEEISRDGVEGATFSLSLPGEKKLQTPVRLDIGPHALGVHAFVCRNPDENHARVHRWLLERNLRMYAVSFAVDRHGDIYLEARLPLASVEPDELDRVLGSVLANADESFNAIDPQPGGVPRLARGRVRPGLTTVAAGRGGRTAPVTRPVGPAACAGSSARRRWPVRRRRRSATAAPRRSSATR
jgi:hypothetical protein